MLSIWIEQHLLIHWQSLKRGHDGIWSMIPAITLPATPHAQEAWLWNWASDCITPYCWCRGNPGSRSLVLWLGALSADKTTKCVSAWCSPAAGSSISDWSFSHGWGTLSFCAWHLSADWNSQSGEVVVLPWLGALIKLIGAPSLWSVLWGLGALATCSAKSTIRTSNKVITHVV